MLRSSLVFITVLVLDQLSKMLVIDHLKDAPAVDLMPGFIELRYAQNTGMAFSFLNEAPALLTAFIIIVLTALWFYIIQSKKFSLEMAFIMAGGMGNLIDRFLYGFVVDFINPVFIDFAIFNIADVSLNIGMYIFVIKTLMHKEEDKQENAI